MQAITNKHFGVIDKVYCVSLRKCKHRQANARAQLSRIGINHFDFFWGTDKNDSIVKHYYDNNLVLTFPPCFRCLKRSCGRDTCNNFLIPAQVATFISFKRVWEDIVTNDIGIAMIVEDDVVFTDYAPSMIQAALNEMVFRDLGISPDSESLIRLGSPDSSECKIGNKVEFVKGAFRASNYCFVITNYMARRLLDSFKRVETTVDNYIHFIVGMKVNNYTLVPPVAFDLSYSEGAVESLIHPKPKRVDYLRQAHPWDADEINRAQEQLDRHFYHILARDILCVGHPRCGSMYMSRLLLSYGLDVRHEEMGSNGISSWMFAVDDENNPYAKNKYALARRYTHFNFTIHHVRNPVDAIPSIIRENRHSELSYSFRRKHIKLALDIELDDFESEIDKAVACFVLWNKIISNTNPDIVVRVENCEEDIFRFLSINNLTTLDHQPETGIDKSFHTDKPYKGVQYDKPVIGKKDWETINPGLKRELRIFCTQYGYENNQFG